MVFQIQWNEQENGDHTAVLGHLALAVRHSALFKRFEWTVFVMGNWNALTPVTKGNANRLYAAQEGASNAGYNYLSSPVNDNDRGENAYAAALIALDQGDWTLAANLGWQATITCVAYAIKDDPWGREWHLADDLDLKFVFDHLRERCNDSGIVAAHAKVLGFGSYFDYDRTLSDENVRQGLVGVKYLLEHLPFCE